MLNNVSLEVNTISQPIEFERLKEHTEISCVFDSIWSDYDVSWLIFWIIKNKFNFFEKKNVVYCLIDKENIVNLLSIIVKIVKTNKLEVPEQGLPEISEGYRKPYDLTYVEKLKFFYNSVRPYINKDNGKFNQFLITFITHEKNG